MTASPSVPTGVVRLVFARGAGSAHATPRRLEWAPTTGRTREPTATIGCPERGHEISLASYSIAPDGHVAPAVLCPHLRCHWSAWIRLDGWTTGR